MTLLGHLLPVVCTEVQGTPTCLLVATDQELKDAIHGPHVEDEAQLRDAHGDETEQQDGAEHAVHERGGRCREKAQGSGLRHTAHSPSRSQGRGGVRPTVPTKSLHPGSRQGETKEEPTGVMVLVLELGKPLTSLNFSVPICKTGQAVPPTLL